MIRLVFVPVAGETDTTPTITDFDPESLEFETAPSYYADFYEEDLEGLAILEVEETDSIWDPRGDVTYEVIRIA